MRPDISPLHQWLFPFVRRLLAPELQQVPSLSVRAENFVIAVAMALVILPFYAVIYHLLGDDASVGPCLSAAGVAIGCLASLRFIPTLSVVREILLLAVYALVVYLSTRQGGVGAPTTIWLAVCPLVATATGGVRPGMIWSGLSMLTVAAIYGVDVAGLFPQAVIRDIRLLGLVSTISFMISVGIFLLIYERINSSAILKLDEALGIIRELAIRDELTGVFNRRELIRVAEREKHRSERQGDTFCLCLIDIDHFKRVNDLHGHAVGDQVLRRIASKVQGDIRKVDCFGRFGGEEFLLLLAGSDAAMGRVQVDRIRQEVESLRFDELETGERVTISAGLAQYGSGESIEETLGRADHALYRAKREGRNRVVIALPAGERDVRVLQPAESEPPTGNGD